MPVELIALSKLIEEHTKLDEKVAQVLGETREKLLKLCENALMELATNIVNAVLTIIFYSGQVIGEALGELECGKEIGAQDARTRSRPALLPLNQAIDSYYKHLIDETKLREELSKHGFSDEKIDLLIEEMRQRPAASDILKAFWYGRLSERETLRQLEELGFSRESAELLLETSYSPLSVSEYIALWLRGEINERELEWNLRHHGLAPADVEYLKRLAFFIPPVNDLIRMAVRECFTPEIASKFGQYEDFPEKFAEIAEKHGVSREWAEAYWAAHWDLPSATMGFEMLHRGIITEDELKMLLRALDIMPYWRDKLIQLSYYPLTRVDVRRMYQMGILNRDQVKKAYKDLGYNEENAEYLTRFTEALAHEDEKELTKTEILSGFRNRMISREEAKEMLRSLAYSEESAELLLSLEEYKREAEFRRKRIEIIRQRYLRGLISENEMRLELTALALPADEIEYYYEVWQSERAAKAETLTVSDLRKAYSRGIISRDNFVERLHRLGYKDDDINIILELERKGG